MSVCVRHPWQRESTVSKGKEPKKHAEEVQEKVAADDKYSMQHSIFLFCVGLWCGDLGGCKPDKNQIEIEPDEPCFKTN
ncbi:hypothetical protein V6N11_032441 [Hibiscus sabdariffa]|uniref:Uncharacterized protein n=1 Tax=Hibiscus sabdariffa TaxID=183260 RepID=A0ABR2T0N6_9ROSI